MENSDLKKIYSYQKRFIYIEAPLYSLIGTLLLLSWFPAIIGYLAYGIIYPSTIRFAVFFDITASILIALIKIVKFDLKKNMFIITDESIIFKATGKLRSMFFNDINLCKHVQTTFAEYVQITSSDKTILLPFSINGIHDLLLHINEYLIVNGKAQTLDEPSPGSMLVAARLRQLAYLREKKAFSPLFLTTFFLTFFNIFIAYKYWELEIIPVLMWAIIGFVLPLNSFALAEQLINKQLKGTDSQFSEKKFEKSAYSFYLFSGFLFLLLYLTAGILFKALC
jgi:hypothetical protein